MRRVPVGRLAVVVAAGVAVWVVAQGRVQPRWRVLRPGLEFGILRGDSWCRRGSSDIALLRLDPRRMPLRVHYYSGAPGQSVPTLMEWRRRLGVTAVFNAGQYYPDLSYMGLLVSDGRAVSARVHPGFHAALVAGARLPGPGARVLDLERDSLDRERPRWSEIAQSFMLFDRGGTLRVRRSEQVANRTVVAEDRQGRLVVIATEGGYTLWELGQFLRDAPLGLTHAMSMDGGREAGLAVQAGDFRYVSLGPWQDAEKDAALARLPAVIAVDAGPP